MYLTRGIEMKSYVIGDIPKNSYFTKTVYLDESFVIAAPEMPFSEELFKYLEKWNFREVYSDGEPLENYLPDEAKGEVSGEIHGITTQADGEKIRYAEKFYSSFQGFVDSLFLQVEASNVPDFNIITRRIKTVVDYLRKDHRFLMRVQKNIDPPLNQNYLASHSARSTIIAIIIGKYLKLQNHRLIELGTAALLHEIGMLKLPPRVYLSTRTLSSQERKVIHGHPMQGYNMLKSFGFPLAVSLAALEHHERENGSGYPQGINGGRISLYGKIIAVACSYEALSSRRPHREAKDGYTGMIELLKNEGKQYDDTIVRALVFSLSIYPIGLYVLLSNGKKGQVVDVDPENPRYPFVQIFGEFTPDVKNRTVQVSQDGLSIVRPLAREEIDS